MALDLQILELHRLMDYSLLFVISFNPRFVNKFKHLFVKDENGSNGELLKPYRLIDEER